MRMASKLVEPLANAAAHRGVAVHHVVAAHEHLAGLARWQGGTAVVDDTHLDAGERSTRGGGGRLGDGDRAGRRAAGALGDRRAPARGIAARFGEYAT